MNIFKRKKHVCLICEKRIGDDSAVVRYRYAEDQMGEARLCNKCANKLDKAEVDTDEWSV